VVDPESAVPATNKAEVDKALDRFDKLIRAARGEFNEDLRAEMYAEAQRLVRDEGGAMIPMFADFVHALSDRIGVAGDPSGPWALDNHKWFERWWID